jgi:hypothetical protein
MRTNKIDKMVLNLVWFLGEDMHVTYNVIQKPIDTGVRRTGRRPDGCHDQDIGQRRIEEEGARREEEAYCYKGVFYTGRQGNRWQAASHLNSPPCFL